MAARGLARCPAATNGSVRACALLDALTSVLELRDVLRGDHLEGLAHMLATEPAVKEQAWRIAIEWARTHPRHEEIEVLGTFAPVLRNRTRPAVVALIRR